MTAPGINTCPALRTWRDTLNGAGGTAEIGPYHPNPDGWYAAGNQSMVDSDIALAKSIGVQYLRFDFPWPFMETASGVYDFSRADYIVNALNTAGITPLPFIAFTPFWINQNATVAPSTAQMSEFATGVANHFKGRIKFIEIWNEPDHGHYWNSGWPAFGPILDAAYKAIKAVDPTIQVVFPGCSSAANTAFWQQTAGVFPNSFDVFGVHDYAGTVGATVSAARSFLTSIGRSGVPVHVGETGISNLSTKSGSDALQKQYVDALFASGGAVASSRPTCSAHSWPTA